MKLHRVCAAECKSNAEVSLLCEGVRLVTRCENNSQHSILNALPTR